MTDLHTHILPGMDDGARDVDASLELLRLETAQGVDTVVLTPHFYRRREDPVHFLTRRAKAAETLFAAIAALPQEERDMLPQLVLGAEVAWAPSLAEWPELPQLCLGQSSSFLLELPSHPWTDQLIDQLYDLPGQTGLTPVIAHIERYLKDQKPQHLEAVFALGVPVQISAEPLLHLLQRSTVLGLLRKNRAQLIASDTHNSTSRPPNLGDALAVVRKKLGNSAADSLAERFGAILL